MARMTPTRKLGFCSTTINILFPSQIQKSSANSRLQALSSGFKILFTITIAVCVEIPMVLSGSTGLCAADSASVAMPRKLDSSSTAKEDGVFHRSR
ncbi:hypothetical protein D5086_002610 [Populus alba]|uniref:Uncharacterized protein n=1 Tax=Populus alba TaxID=43335 RepID=A0ACC4D3B3_POPAL